MSGGRKVLFVCSGNICRSPLAEAMAKARFGDRLEISSAGTAAIPGDPATELMVEAAAEYDMDLTGHRARRLSAVARPDVVFGMGPSHLAAVRQQWPELDHEAVHLLDHPNMVPDPYGHGIEAYREAAAHINRAIDALEM